MEKKNYKIACAIKIMQIRRQIMFKRLRENHSNFLSACKQRKFQHEAILQTLNADYLVSIAASVLNNRKDRRFKTRPRSDHYWTLIKQPKNSELYFECLRISKSSFNKLCNLIRPLLPQQKVHLTIPVPPEKQIAICLYKLGSGAEYRVVGDIFGVHKSTVCKYFHIVINAILEISKQFIKMPHLEEFLEIAKGFEGISKIPNIIGSIDSTHIPVLAPSKRNLDYINRKGWPSIVMQAIVDDKYMFRNVSVQFPGSVHDATVFDESGVFKHASKVIPSYTMTINDVSTPLMLVGDPSYPLLPWLLKPYTASLTRSQEYFNYTLSSARVCVENAFERLKGRWHCLSKRTDVGTEFVKKIVVACAILHNFCERENEHFDNSWIESSSDPLNIYQQPNDIISSKIISDEKFDPKYIRDNIKNYLTSTG